MASASPRAQPLRRPARRPPRPAPQRRWHAGATSRMSCVRLLVVSRPRGQDTCRLCTQPDAAPSGLAGTIRCMSTVRKPKAPRDLVAEVAAAQSLGRRLPRGNSSLPKALTQDTQRIRLYYGLAASLVDKGYAATTLGDITRHAGVSRATFYELFEDKEDCFLGGFRIMAGIHLKSVRDAMALADHPAERCSRALAAYLERIDDHPALAVAFFPEAEAASPSIRDAPERMQAEWVELIASVVDGVRAAHPWPPPRLCFAPRWRPFPESPAFSGSVNRP
ncbi:MAG: TetR/AcrR family transcriptional regulator [Aquabacterium sp.]|nr:MAG: TetR/AcrR family transcriptional regulator [Aquabacterium sp.]